MAKHKEIKMWGAQIHSTSLNPEKGGKTIKTYCGRVVETPKQYKIVRDNRDEKQSDLMRCCGYKSIVNKKGNIWLYPTELEALNALDQFLVRQEELASARAAVAQENLFLITEALGDYNEA